MYKAKFNFCKKKIVADYELKKKDITANFNLNITPSVSQFVTKEELEEATDTFVFEQGIASDTWVIEHNLGKHPSVTVVDTAGTVFTASVEYNSDNVCTVYINGATKGKAYLN